MAYGRFQVLDRRTAGNKAFNIAKSPKYDGYQHGLAWIIYNFLDKKTLGGPVKNDFISNKELAEEIHKLIIRKFENRKVHSPFIDNIWGTDLADMLLISKCDKGFIFLLCVIEIYSKYAWVVPFKDKKGNTIADAFQKYFRWIKSQIK